ncbi:MAG: HypC/HybG/HupF family hydrogenase formation chaperone [Haliea sp.]|jgi:hydrogenase expression/formation protein HypC|nr:HypC/HybG/HupF family hydrogenase formation chaperone [Haliea sp.]
MCLAIPVQITELLDGDRALASVGGVVREIGTSLVDNLEVGDYVILHVGYALSRLNEEEAQETLRAMEEIGAIAGDAR